MSRKPKSFAEALKMDVLEGRMSEMNHGDRARYEMEEELERERQEEERQRMIDDAVRRVNDAFDRQERGEL